MAHLSFTWAGGQDKSYDPEGAPDVEAIFRTSVSLFVRFLLALGVEVFWWGEVVA